MRFARLLTIGGLAIAMAALNSRSGSKADYTMLCRTLSRRMRA
jgi:hypothetical protein